MKKILFILPLFVFLFLSSVRLTEAVCVPRLDDQCSGQVPFLCSADGSDYCCEGIAECSSEPPPPTCNNGERQYGETYCDPAQPQQAFTCNAGGSPVIIVQNCTSSEMCVEGEGCVARPAPSASQPGPTSTSQPPPPAPPDPLLPNDSFLILTNPLTVDAGNCSTLLECTIADPFGALRVVQFSRPGGILSALLPWLFTFAGLILFIMLLWGGFEMLSGAATPKSQEAGKQRITAALTGFALLFMSYWFAQIIEYIFGLNIL